jgi:hypothetical protein
MIAFGKTISFNVFIKILKAVFEQNFSREAWGIKNTKFYADIK